MWYDVNDEDGNAVTTTIAAGDYAPLSPYLFGARAIRATSSASQTGAGFVTLRSDPGNTVPLTHEWPVAGSRNYVTETRAVRR